ncbi:biotin--[acetyl-CoA-carboxylase] ligase [bacterium]|nr:MAG: biotin--[acetyl-CoA-carboxylase] ligase [bacterium]
MQEKLLELLKKKHDYISGEDISDGLGMSRQALWKHIQELRDSGYDIVAVPHLGYKLDSVPDRLFPQEIQHKLNTKFIGKKIHYFDKVSSTMDEAMRLGMGNTQEGTLIVAESQGKGRGRLGRLWDSPKYKGIYLSLILRPDILPNHCPTLTLLAAVSICEAVNLVCGLDCQIKWPNDILIHHKKVAGILTELNAEMDRVSFVLIGIGLNVNNDKKDLVSGATSLKEQKKEDINRIELLQELLRRIEENYVIFQKEGPQIILDKWRRNSLTLGTRVKVACQKEHLEGEAIDIDSDGGLLIRKDSGIIEKVMSGDVVHCR